MKKTNQFIASIIDFRIFVGTVDAKQGWNVTEQLQGHNHVITCMILNSQEDLLISGGYDVTLRFWTKKNIWECSQTIVVDQGNVSALSLNQSESKLISCWEKGGIIILELSKSESTWSAIQTIKVNEGLDFLNNYTFVFQPNEDNFLAIYKQDQQDSQFKLIKIINQNKSNRSFPMNYVEQQNLILIKAENVVNLIKYNEEYEQEFEILQQFEQQTQGIGSLTEDAQFLITWEGDNIFENRFGFKEIQIRMLKKIN